MYSNYPSTLTLQMATKNSLESFAETQLSGTEITEIAHRTFSLIAVSTFFIGVAHEFGPRLKLQAKEPPSALVTFLMQTFNLDRANVLRLITIIMRLTRKYLFIDKVFSLGRSTARRWTTGGTMACYQLQDLVEYCRELDMSDLGIDGIKTRYLTNQNVVHEWRGKFFDSSSISPKRIGIALLVIFILCFNTIAIWYVIAGDRIFESLMRWLSLLA